MYMHVQLVLYVLPTDHLYVSLLLLSHLIRNYFETGQTMVIDLDLNLECSDTDDDKYFDAETSNAGKI